MPNRRESLTQIIAGALSAGSTAAFARSYATLGAPSKPLRILILGGTGHIGPFHVRAAVGRGHEVAVFSRGREHVNLPASVERLIGDRNGNLDSIRYRDWDAVLDLATFGPGWVRSLGQALRGRVGHYTFVSTISVYDDLPADRPVPETSRLLAYRGAADPYAPVNGEGADYGALKVLCEKEAERQFPGRTFVSRPGYVVLPGDLDHNGFVTYWPARAVRGGGLMAAGDPSTPIQYLDIRDMAEWIIRMVEKRATGIYNTVGPARPTGLGQLIDAAREFAPRPTRVTWVPIKWLTARQDNPMWGQLYFWYFQGLGGLTRIAIDRALAAGFTTRPLTTTLATALRWYQQEPAAQRVTFVTGHRRENDGHWVEIRASWAGYLQHERAALASWHALQAGSRAGHA